MDPFIPPSAFDGQNALPDCGEHHLRVKIFRNLGFPAHPAQPGGGQDYRIQSQEESFLSRVSKFPRRGNFQVRAQVQ